MNHNPCPTFIYNRPTLAPRENSSPNFPLSLLHLEGPSELPLLLTDSRPGPDDFQSNSSGNFDLPNFDPSAVGLGISYDWYTSEKTPSNTAHGIENVLLAETSQSGSVYDLFKLDYHPEPLSDELYSLFESQLPTSCSFSPTHSGSSSPNDAGSIVAKSLSQQSLTLQYPDSVPWSLELVSTAAAGQITELAPQHLASGSYSSLSSISDLSLSEDLLINHFASEPASHLDLYPWPVLADYATAIHSVPDIQQRHHLDGWKEPCFAVNPAEIMTDSSQDPDVDYSYILFSPEPDILYLPQGCASDHCSPDEERANEDKRSPNFNGDIYVNPINAVATSEIGACYHVYPVGNRNQKEPSEYETSSPETSPFPSPQQRKRARKSRKSQLKILPTDVDTTDMSLVKSEPLVKGELTGEDGLCNLDVDADGINLGTPVFDAHRGIDLDDLKSKAARFRLRNPGREYDNAWLVSFAGKLSKQGKLLDNFRCYVLGCDQVNKRRDHILIHVGAHLDQRPFQCRYCTSRFLRKNECKRHEMSHSGNRPFHCDQCPSGVATFVRQDLLKRHLKRTHGIENNKENLRDRPLKRARRV